MKTFDAASHASQLIVQGFQLSSDDVQLEDVQLLSDVLEFGETFGRAQSVGFVSGKNKGEQQASLVSRKKYDLFKRFEVSCGSFISQWNPLKSSKLIKFSWFQSLLWSCRVLWWSLTRQDLKHRLTWWNKDSNWLKYSKAFGLQLINLFKKDADFPSTPYNSCHYPTPFLVGCLKSQYFTVGLGLLVLHRHQTFSCFGLFTFSLFGSDQSLLRREGKHRSGSFPVIQVRFLLAVIFFPLNYYVRRLKLKEDKIKPQEHPNFQLLEKEKLPTSHRAASSARRLDTELYKRVMPRHCRVLNVQKTWFFLSHIMVRREKKMRKSCFV